MIPKDRVWRVLVVDDHPLVRDALRSVLQQVVPGAVVDDAGTAPEALHKIAEQMPDLALLDVNLPGMSGIELARQIQASKGKTKLLVISAESDPWTVQQALQAGAFGFLAKASSTDELIQAITAVLLGETYLSQEAQAALQRAEEQNLNTVDPPGPAVLTTREREILIYLAKGENTKNIASLLSISPKTVETHRQHITRKLRTSSVAALARYALRHGLTSL